MQQAKKNRIAEKLMSKDIAIKAIRAAAKITAFSRDPFDFAGAGGSGSFRFAVNTV